MVFHSLLRLSRLIPRADLLHRPALAGAVAAGVWLYAAGCSAQWSGPVQSPAVQEEMHFGTDHRVDPFCEPCWEEDNLGWSPLPPRYDDDWGEHYRPLFQWMQHSPLWFLWHEPPAGRHTGRGVPLERASWLNRPYHAGFGLGTLWGGSLSRQVEAAGDLFGVLRLGTDTSHFTGWEARLAFAAPEVSGGGVAADSSAEIYLADLNSVYYPWGDSLWRPYFSIGLGLAYYRYETGPAEEVKDALFSVPVALGLKYRHGPRFSARMEVTDYITFGGRELDFRNTLTAGAGLEWRYGGHRPSYWPWNAGRHEF